MPQNKNQHFVPQYYLKLFSFDGGKRLRLLHLETGRVVLEAPLKSQCANAYFYGKNLVVEKVLKGLEGEDATMLMELIRSERVPKWPERARLYATISMLHLRTERSVLALQRGATAMLTEMARRMVKSGDLPFPEGCSLDALTVSDANISAQAVMHGFDAAPFLFDLDIRLLKAPNGLEFYTSDHPVVAVNQALQDRDSRMSTTGLAMRGLQLFLPLGPKLCLVFFDAACYRIGRPGREMVTISREADMDIINALQVLNAGQHLYFTGDESQRALELRSCFLKGRPRAENLDLRIERADGGLILGNMKEYFRIPAIWSFCKIRKNAPRAFKPRNPEMERLNTAWQEDRRVNQRKISFLEFCSKVNAKRE